MDRTMTCPSPATYAGRCCAQVGTRCDTDICLGTAGVCSSSGLFATVVKGLGLNCLEGVLTCVVGLQGVVGGVQE